MELTLFPQGALSSSVITTVWVGVAVIAFLNLRFGTTLSGLVIPGYLVPLLLLRPVSALVIVGEGLVTYLLGLLLAEKLPRFLNYSEFFGRDRFFALVLLSVAVRLVFDGLLLPEMGEYLWGLGIHFDYRNNLHSFGLIIVALIANQMWNGGVMRGTTALFTYTAISYILVRYVLMDYTNFNISSMNYMYEDLASSILASPKAYIILLVSAFIASRMNLQYGWEFNGILIPSLLALQWYQPTKLVVTFVEAGLIYFVAILVLRIPWMKSLNIEGARQILLFFNISFIYKIILGYVIIAVAPELKVSDFFAFGYLLSTLIALKMYQKDIAVRITRATLHTSLVAVVFASVVGYLLTFLPSGNSSIEDTSISKMVSIEEENQTLIPFLLGERSKLYASTDSILSGQANPLELDSLNQGFKLLSQYFRHRDAVTLQHATQVFQSLDMRLTQVQNYLVLTDNQTERGWGIYALNLESKSSLIIEVPAPLDELQSVDVAAQLFIHSEAKGLAMTGMRRKQSLDGSSDVLSNSQTPFQLFHRYFGLESAVQIREYTNQSRRSLLGQPEVSARKAASLSTNQLWVKGSIPRGLNVRLLEEVLPDFELNWRETPLPNRQREQSIEGFSELFLSKEGVRKLLAFGGFSKTIDEQVASSRIDGYLLSSIKQDKGYLARKGSEAYQPPLGYELLYFDQAVLSPLFDLLQRTRDQEWSDAIAAEVAQLGQLAAAVDYQVIRYVHQGSNDNFIILREQDNPNMKHWGLFVFRVGDAVPAIVEVPRPIAEQNTLEFGVALFENTRAQALLIAGAHPQSNADGSADVLSNDYRASLFNTAHQVWLRESLAEPAIVLQLRAMSESRSVDQLDAIISRLKVGALQKDHLFGLIAKQLDSYGITFQVADGSYHTRGYETSLNAQSDYMEMTQDKAFYTLWIAPSVRRQYKDQGDNQVDSKKFAALGIESQEVDLARWLSSKAKRVVTEKMEGTHLLEAYLSNGNIVSLHAFLNANARFSFTRLIDKNTRQAFLLVAKNDVLVSLINLDTYNESTWYLNDTDIDTIQIRSFIDSRRRWLSGERT